MYSFQLSSDKALVRFDIVGGPEREHIVEDPTFLNYRLGDVKESTDVTKDKADIVWYYDEQPKSIEYVDEQLILKGFWEEGELNKIMVTMMANAMDKCGLHPFHSSSVLYRGKMILLVGGENNHGKSMTQLEGCRRGAKVFSTETTITDEDGLFLFGSKNVYVRKRAKGTERSDLADQDEGVAKFFDKEPEMPETYDSAYMDLAILPCIDGHFRTEVKKMGQFEAAYQSFHSLMNFFGLNQLLSGEDVCKVCTSCSGCSRGTDTASGSDSFLDLDLDTEVRTGPPEDLGRGDAHGVLLGVGRDAVASGS